MEMTLADNMEVMNLTPLQGKSGNMPPQARKRLRRKSFFLSWTNPNISFCRHTQDLNRFHLAARFIPRAISPFVHVSSNMLLGIRYEHQAIVDDEER